MLETTTPQSACGLPTLKNESGCNATSLFTSRLQLSHIPGKKALPDNLAEQIGGAPAGGTKAGHLLGGISTRGKMGGMKPGQVSLIRIVFAVTWFCVAACERGMYPQLGHITRLGCVFPVLAGIAALFGWRSAVAAFGVATVLSFFIV